MHSIKPIAQSTPDDVRAMAQAAAERDEPLDTANVFAVGTQSHALFTSEYLVHFAALEAA